MSQSEYVQLPIKNISLITYNIIKKIKENQRLLKCLKYKDINALIDDINYPDLTSSEKLELIDVLDTSNARILRTMASQYTTEDSVADLRVYINYASLDNYYLSMIDINFDIVIHSNIWFIYDNIDGNIELVERWSIIANELLKTLNNQDVNGIGYLTFIDINRDFFKLLKFGDNFNGYRFHAKIRMT